eukprot:6181602-Pleurochrysis_carterae.AAC.2
MSRTRRAARQRCAVALSWVSLRYAIIENEIKQARCCGVQYDDQNQILGRRRYALYPGWSNAPLQGAWVRAPEQ